MRELVERQAAIDALDCSINITGKENAETVINLICGIRDRIKALPLAEPERKKGKWITEECLPGVAVCSICGHEIRGIGCQYTKYCDECGARMDEND